MRCPKCGGDTQVIDSRPDEKHGWYIWRRRRCYDCTYRFTTEERART